MNIGLCTDKCTALYLYRRSVGYSEDGNGVQLILQMPICRQRLWSESMERCMKGRLERDIAELYTLRKNTTNTDIG